MPDAVGEQVLELAKRHHKAGRYQDAEPLYRKYLTEHPNHADALHLLGYMLYQMEQGNVGLEMIRRAIALEGGRADFYCNIGVVLAGTHQHEEATEAYLKAIELKPNFPEAYYNMGVSWGTRKRIEKAIDCYRKSLELFPQYAEAAYNLGQIYVTTGDLPEAIELFRLALQSKPNFAEAAHRLGQALLKDGKVDEAIAAFREALARRPSMWEACYELANLLRRRGNLQEAASAYRRLIAMAPQYVDAQMQLGNTLRAMGETAEALEVYRTALTLQPNKPELYHNMGMALEMRNELTEAVAAYEKAIKLRPEYVESMNNLGNALKDSGHVPEAIRSFTSAIAQRDQPVAHSNLLYSMHLIDTYEPGPIFREHQQWNQVHASALTRAAPAHENDRTPDRRLKVGYVSPDFRDHSVAYFLQDILASHRAASVEVYCYSDVVREDAFTRRLQKSAHQWRKIVGLSDQQAAEKIRQDRIDILVDLSGHTAGNRLLMFARKPAPIQITYIGYPDTTGLTAMDYRIVDHLTDPAGPADELCSEKLRRMPNCFLVYSPPGDAPQVNALPAAEGKGITFGSFNNLAKISDTTVRMWAEILRRTPASRLMIKSRGLADAAACDHLRERFALCEIGPERLQLVGQVPKVSNHLTQYHQVDIALDTYPYNGTTTTCEALWMGVPVITRSGATHASRVGLSILTNTKLADLVSDSEEDYVDLATDLANDLESLKSLRPELRGWVKNSTIMNPKTFIASLEFAYREFWAAYCPAEAAAK